MINFVRYKWGAFVKKQKFTMPVWVGKKQGHQVSTKIKPSLNFFQPKKKKSHFNFFSTWGYSHFLSQSFSFLFLSFFLRFSVLFYFSFFFPPTHLFFLFQVLLLIFFLKGTWNNLSNKSSNNNKNIRNDKKTKSGRWWIHILSFHWIRRSCKGKKRRTEKDAFLVRKEQKKSGHMR